MDPYKVLRELYQGMDGLRLALLFSALYVLLTPCHNVKAPANEWLILGHPPSLSAGVLSLAVLLHR